MYAWVGILPSRKWSTRPSSNGRGGPGWLEGFNELVTRCGYEWVGHPGMDKALKQVSEIQDGARLKCDRRRWLI
jgi:hypothetical protein